MMQYVLKVVISVTVIVVATELSKRQTWWGALLVSLPLVSLLSMTWLYMDTGDAGKVATFAQGIFWLVLPSLALFVVMPLLIRVGWGYWPALLLGCAATAALYVFELWLLPRLGVRI